MGTVGEVQDYHDADDDDAMQNKQKRRKLRIDADSTSESGNESTARSEPGERRVKSPRSHHAPCGRPPAPAGWSTQQQHVGKRVARWRTDEQPRVVMHGVVETYAAACEGDEALWHVRHDDGDSEDLDKDELGAALQLECEDPTKSPRKAPSSPPADRSAEVRG